MSNLERATTSADAQPVSRAMPEWNFGSVKPCPFCGEGWVVPVEQKPNDWSMLCMGGFCGAVGPVRLTEAEAIAAWNRRAQ